MSKDNAGWEVEGFIDRLTRRDDSNSERLMLEAISHLRSFSRDCDGLRAALTEAEREKKSIRDTCVALNKYNDELEARLDEALARAERAETATPEMKMAPKGQ